MSLSLYLHWFICQNGHLQPDARVAGLSVGHGYFRRLVLRLHSEGRGAGSWVGLVQLALLTPLWGPLQEGAELGFALVSRVGWCVRRYHVTSTRAFSHLVPGQTLQPRIHGIPSVSALQVITSRQPSASLLNWRGRPASSTSQTINFKLPNPIRPVQSDP